MKTVILSTEKQAMLMARTLNRYGCYATYDNNKLSYHANSIQALKLYSNLPKNVKKVICFL